MPNIAIFASGAGSNAREIIRHFEGHIHIHVSLIVCNKPEAGVLRIAQAASIPFLIISREKFLQGDAYISELRQAGIDFIVLAGFLWKIPPALVAAFPRRIINIHPALLPAFGGKGMYGLRVHQAVLDQGEKKSGITIHYVDDQYDHGETIFQARCTVDVNDSAESLAGKVHQLEHFHYPRVIEDLLTAS